MQQILPELKDNTAVYVVSPQWFTKKGYDSSAFQQSFNSDQLNSFIANHQQDAASPVSYTHLEGSLTRLPERDEINPEINEALVVEFYNKML